MRATELPSAERILRDNRDNIPSEDRCQFIGVQCDDYIDYESGKCYDCGDDGQRCRLLEYLPDFYLNPDNVNSILNDYRKDSPQNLYLLTSSQPSYCLYHYMIEVIITDLCER